jgi:glutathione S-transferase
VTDRPAYHRGKELDAKLMAEIEARQAQTPQPA